MRLGIGGGFLGLRGGISNKGIGAGVGPFSFGTSWKGGGGGGATAMGWFLVVGIFFFAVAWPYFLGTFIAVKLGAENPSTGRLVVGICFQTVFLASLAAWFMSRKGSRADRAADEVLRVEALRASGAISEVRRGRTLIYQHDTCAVKHRSPEAAAKCRRPALTPTGTSMRATPVAGARLPAHRRAVNRLAARWGGAVLSLGFAGALIVLLVDPIDSPSELAAPGACPSQTTSSGLSRIQIPDLSDQAADEAEARLTSLGLENVELSSINPDYKSVWAASNWTVVSTDPGAGCMVGAYSPVRIKVTKP